MPLPFLHDEQNPFEAHHVEKNNMKVFVTVSLLFTYLDLLAPVSSEECLVLDLHFCRNGSSVIS